MTLDDAEQVIAGLLKALKVAGIVIEIDRGTDEPAAYQVAAAALRWKAGDGSRTRHDPIRVPNLPEEGGKPNRFFVDLYRGAAADTRGIEAREHTAQVPAEEREAREERFREAKLLVLFCSPTMELGVDIAELNVVNMRNVPPTPANYAQRSGRAGRSGQPALVFNYCAAGSSHDQYFFRRPELMVAGQVQPPRLELANEDLVRAHVHALWLAETGKYLGPSLAHVLELEGDPPTLELAESIVAAFDDPTVATRATERSQQLLESIPGLDGADWYGPTWLEATIAGAPRAFDTAAARWRSLYRAALDQREAQHRIENDQSRSSKDRRAAKSLRAQAEMQRDLLRGEQDRGSAIYSDFYSYRYFASEAFLPGYNFPRLPLSAFIPGRRGSGRDEFLQRPRFLAISEFGPRSFVYHEGARYVINKVILPVDRTEEGAVPTVSVKQCSSCGYLHPVTDTGGGLDMCERCAAPLDPPIDKLFRLENVSTRRRDRISSDEEERLRQGFEIRTGVRFDGAPPRSATVAHDGAPIAKLSYGNAATLWRMNMGWSRRANPNQLGFVLDLERGYWAKNDQEAIEDQDDPMSQAKARVIPYVEDRRNALLYQPLPGPVGEAEAASLMAALKVGIQLAFQLESSELAVEPLPNRDSRHLGLFYEAAEGGAGVLRQLTADPQALAAAARAALGLCHFDPTTGDDLGLAPGAREACEAACHYCLLSYQNQSDHKILDRQLVLEPLLALLNSTVEVSPADDHRGAHMRRLMDACDTKLERQFLQLLEDHQLELPSDAQYLIATCKAKPDFYYARDQAAIFIDGPPSRLF